jgi:hypothetical protein
MNKQFLINLILPLGIISCSLNRNDINPQLNTEGVEKITDSLSLLEPCKSVQFVETCMSVQFTINKGGTTYYLSGNPANKDVLLTSNKDAPETKWKIIKVGGLYAIYLSNNPKYRWLDAVTKEQRLTLRPFRYGEPAGEKWGGTRWIVKKQKDNSYKLNGAGGFYPDSYIFIDEDNKVKLTRGESNGQKFTTIPDFETLPNPMNNLSCSTGGLCDGSPACGNKTYINNNNICKSISVKIQVYRIKATKTEISKDRVDTYQLSENNGTGKNGAYLGCECSPNPNGSKDTWVYEIIEACFTKDICNDIINK